ncbi:uncharacterized protein LOC142336253 isoform X3 [Convolutriloba macropyga]|uniref:uncharacterized protein LOC142336253 isoform X3 n=1 Tax=Convolutriloba macropyga TaxID=536237 RepID=UPI003F51F30A
MATATVQPSKIKLDSKIDGQNVKNNELTVSRDGGGQPPKKERVRHKEVEEEPRKHRKDKKSRDRDRGRRSKSRHRDKDVHDGLARYATVDEFEENELATKLKPLSWDQLKNCDLLTKNLPEDKHESAGVDPPFLQIDQKEEGTVHVKWVNKPLQNQKNAVSRKMSTFEGPPEKHKIVKPEDIVLKLTGYELFVTGTNFAPECGAKMSDSYVDDSNQLEIFQHMWEFPGDENSTTLDCLSAGDKYKFRVVAVYEVTANEEVFNERVKSVNKFFITIGRPAKPDIRISDLDPLQVMLTWSLIETHPKVSIGGYLVSLDDGDRTLEVGPDVRFPAISDLTPNSLHEVRVKVLSHHSSGDSDFSDPIFVRVPERPAKPVLELQPIVDVGKITIQWHVSGTEQKFERANWCSIYIAHGEHRAFLFQKIAVASRQMQYTFQDLNLGQEYRCYVQTHAGTNEVSRTGSFGVCEIISEESNSVYFTPCAPPIPGTLTAKCFYQGGFQMQWEDPQEFGDAHVSGYQLIKDGQPYGPVLSSSARVGCIDEAVPGSFYRIQLVALCEHQICRKPFIIQGFTSTQYFMKVNSSAKLETAEQRKLQGLVAETKKIQQQTKPIAGYEGCLPGYSVVVPYRGLVHPPQNIKIVDVKGSSAVVQWSLWSLAKMMKSAVHFKRASHHRVYWWLDGEEESYEDDTDTNEITLTFLKPNARYNLAIESRRIDENELGSLIVKNVSEVISFSTGSPPNKPSDVTAIGRTTNSLTVGWKRPEVEGYILHGYRIEVRETMDGFHELEESEIKCFNIDPSKDQFTITELAHTTIWKITLMVISNRYFEASKNKSLKNVTEIPLELKFDEIVNHWLPYVTISASTLPLNDEKTVVVSKLKPNAITLKWTSFKTPNDQSTDIEYEKQVVWYNEYSEHGRQSARYFDSITLDPDDRCFTLDNLEPATVYQINLEATSIAKKKNTLQMSGKKYEVIDKENDDTVVHVYDSLLVRTPAPIKSSDLCLTGYTTNSIRVAWAKPCTHRNPDDVFATRIIRRDLREYRVVINGKAYQPVDINQQMAILTKCQPGKTYHLVLSTITSTYHQFKDKDLMAKFSRSLDYAHSLPVTINLPELDKGHLVQAFDCEFVKESPEGQNAEGYVKVRWSLYKKDEKKTNAEMGIDNFEIVWESDSADDEIYSVTVNHSDSWVLLPVDQPGSIFKIFMIVMFNTEDQEAQKSEVLKFQVPTRPPKPVVHIHHVSQAFFIIEWLHEGAKGVNQTAGFQAYIDGKKAGNVLDPNFFKAKIASKPENVYSIRLVALSSNPQIEDSEMSDPLLVPTDQDTIDYYKQMYIDMHGLADVDLDLLGGGRLGAAGERRGEMKLALVELSDVVMTFRVLDLDSDSVAHVKVEWNSFDSAETKQLLLPADQKDISLDTFGGGVNHFIRFFGVEEHGIVVTKSKQITALSAKKLEPPVLKAKKVSFEELIVSWSSTRDAKELMIGYRVFINGRQITEVDNTVTEYVFTKGQMCREYKFEVQALANQESLDSKISKPLVVLWPGIITPDIDEVMTTTGNAIKIAWNRPFSSKNVQILGYWIYCKMNQEHAEDLRAEKRMIVGPLPSETTSYQFENLSTVCQYEIHMELKIAGLDQFLQSNQLMLQPVRFPHAPVIKITLNGQNERPQLEQEICRLLRNWWIMNGFGTSSASFNKSGGSSDERQEINDLYRKMEPVLTKLAQFTGKIEGEITWDRLDSENKDKISGFKVMVNGSQVGALLPKNQNKFNFKLSMGKPEYNILVASVVENSSFPLQKSNKVFVDSNLFKPFAVFCYFKVHSRVARWPNRGCCSVSDMIGEEIQDNSKLKRQLAASLPGPIRPTDTLAKEWPNPYVYNVLQKEETTLHMLFDSDPSDAKNRKLRSGFTVILFYTNWCLSSQKVFRQLTRWASTNDLSTKLITCCVSSGEPPDIHYTNVAKFVKRKNESGQKFWFGDNMQHVCGCFSQSGGVIDMSKKDSSPARDRSGAGNVSKRILEMFNLIGVPTISIVAEHSESVVWQGRPLAATDDEFATFFTDVIHTLPRPF